MAYRLQLWAAIRRARGFTPSFVGWWAAHATDFDFGAPSALPGGPPGTAVAEAIFLHFKCSFEKFENWHLRQRSSALKLKHDRSLDALHQELRDSKGASLQLLEYRHEYIIEVVDPTGGVIFVDREVSVGGASTWTIDGSFFTPSFVSGASLRISRNVSQLVGSTLVQHQTCHPSPISSKPSWIFGLPNGKRSTISRLTCGIVWLALSLPSCLSFPITFLPSPWTNGRKVFVVSNPMPEVLMD